MNPTCVLATMTGRDRPGVVAAFFAALAAHDVDVHDVEQLVIRDRLILTVLFDLRGDTASLRHSVTTTAEALGMESELVIAPPGGATPPRATGARHNVILLGHPLRPGAVSHVAQRIADSGGNIETVAQLSTEPAAALEMVVQIPDADRLRAVLVRAAAETGLDIAIEPARLRRRAKRLILLDADTTLLRDSALDVLAAHAGVDLPADGDVHARTRALAGVPAQLLDEAAAAVELAPGAATFVRTLRRLGFYVGAVSAGFTVVLDRVATTLELDFAAANQPQIDHGVLTGALSADVLDGHGKAAALQRFADAYGVPASQTIAIGNGPHDAEMLARAGLGIVFNARSAQRATAGTAEHYLDSLLFVLGITREEIAEAQ